MSWVIAAVAVILVVAISYVVEAMRPQPAAPDGLDWASDITIRYAMLKGTRVRYVATGRGPALVLLRSCHSCAIGPIGSGRAPSIPASIARGC
jgi:hypothetical protein